MKSITFILVFFVTLNSAYLFSQDRYDEDPHKYIVSQAWLYLQSKKPEINWQGTVMKQYMEINWDCGDDENPWLLSFVTTGACREDREDPIYNYQWPWTTVSHFWNADVSDTKGLDNYPSAYSKARAYMYGEHRIFERGNYRYGSQNIAGFHRIIPNLFDFCKTGYCILLGYRVRETGRDEFFQNPIHGNLNIDNRRRIAFLILGRLAHLLTDMSVPVHAKGESHASGDSYENWVDANYSYYNYTLPYHGTNNPNFGPGGIINLANKENPLRFLYFLTNQIADRFPTDTKPENTYIRDYIYNPDGIADYIEPIYASINNNHIGRNEYRADYLVNFSIKAVASLLYWFFINTEQMPPPVPVITNITANMIGDPSTGFTLYKGQTGVLYSTVQGSPVLYQWNYSTCNSGWLQWPYADNGIFTQFSQIYPHFVLKNEDYAGQFCSIGENVPPALHFFTKLRVYNNSGENYSNTFRINPSINLAGGGCPYIFVLGNDTTGDRFFVENNILHHSEFTENINQSITDVYKLNTVPKIDSNKITIQIMETENDVNYFDQIKLFAVDHPVGSKIGITESNDIVMYYPDDVSSSDFATQNFSSNNIAPYIQYGQPSPKITGVSNDFVNSHYDSTSQNIKLKSYKNRLKAKGYKTISDSLALIGEIGSDALIQPIVAKDWAGSISIYTNSDTYVKPFSKRVNVSGVIIPFSQSDENVDHIDINFNSDYAMSYFSVVPVSYEGFIKTELSLTDAVHAVNGNILASLSDVDSVFAIMDTTAIIDLKFGNINPPDPSMVRDYIFVVNGKYTSQNSSYRNQQLSSLINNNSNPQNIAYKYKLNTNYPNPFNPNTKINYSLSKPGITKLQVYDVLGRLVNVLVNEYKSAGEYTVDFNGSHLSSGVYIYRLESNDFVDTKRMVLIK